MKRALVLGLVSLALSLVVTGASMAQPDGLISPGETETSTVTFTETVATPGGAVTVPTTATIVATTQSAGAGAADATAATSGCWIGTFTITTTSLGVTQHRWRHVVEWCGNGSSITGIRRNIGENLYTGTFWNYISSTSRRSGGAGSPYFTAFAQGHYCYRPGVPTCLQNNYPRHEGRYNPNGTWSTIAWAPR